MDAWNLRISLGGFDARLLHCVVDLASNNPNDGSPHVEYIHVYATAPYATTPHARIQTQLNSTRRHWITFSPWPHSQNSPERVFFLSLFVCLSQFLLGTDISFLFPHFFSFVIGVRWAALLLLFPRTFDPDRLSFFACVRLSRYPMEFTFLALLFEWRYLSISKIGRRNCALSIGNFTTFTTMHVVDFSPCLEIQ